MVTYLLSKSEATFDTSNQNLLFSGHPRRIDCHTSTDNPLVDPAGQPGQRIRESGMRSLGIFI